MSGIMPYKRCVLATGETYHIYNKSVRNLKIFSSKAFCKRFLELLWYYQFTPQIMSYSTFKKLPIELQLNLTTTITSQSRQVECLGFVLMPNHYHLLLTQLEEDGIRNYVACIQKAFSLWLGLHTHTQGPVFKPRFRGRHVSSTEELLHTMRYIHLNPVTSYIITPDEIDSYKWSSWPAYTNSESAVGRASIVNPVPVLSQFLSLAEFRRFVLDQANYQRQLKYFKDLNID